MLRAVVHVIGSLDRGGTETRLIEAFESLRAAGTLPPTHLVLLSGRTGPLAERAEAAGVALHPLPLGPGFPIRFIRLLRRLSAGVVHSHVHLVSGYLTTLGVIARTPRRIAHFRSSGDGMPSSSIRTLRDVFLRRMILLTATDVLAGTSSVMAAVWGAEWRRRSRFAIVPQGVDVGAAIRALNAVQDEPGRIEIVQIGRLDEDKNQLHAIRAYSRLSAEHARSELTLVGRPTGAYSDTLSEEIRQLGIEDRVTMPGETADVQAQFARSAVMIHPTRREGWPGVIIEAAVSGLPVVCSDIPPNREVAGSLANVRLVSLDAPLTTWAEALARALDSRPSRDERVEIARQAQHGPLSAESAARALLPYWTTDR